MTRRGFTPLYDRGQLLVDLAVTQLLGGEAISDFQGLRHLAPVIGPIPSNPTVWRAMAEVGGLQLARITGIKVAAGLNLPAPTSGFTPESAAWALILKGIKVRAELASSLTEADAVGVLTGLGYKIRTATPSRVMTSDRVDILLKTFLPPDKA